MEIEDNNTTGADNSSLSCWYCLDITDNFSVQGGFPIILGYVVPSVILVTIVTNTLAITVLLKRNVRTSTNILLAGLAFSDMMCGVSLLPIFIKFFTLKTYGTLVEYEWCLPCKMLVAFSTGFHTVSVFQTVFVAVQRYIFVCRSTNHSKQSGRSVIILVACLHVVGILVHITSFVDVEFSPLDVIQHGHVTRACQVSNTDWVDGNYEIYVNIYFWFRSMCLVVIPCVSLIILTGLLLRTLTLARIRRKLLFEGREDSMKQQERQHNRTTMMLVAVVGLFLIFETPNAVVISIDAIEVAMGTYSNTESKRAAITIANVVVLVGCPANIFLYCGMSKQFRDTLKQIFALALVVIVICIYSLYKVPSLYWSLKVRLALQKQQNGEPEKDNKHVEVVLDKLDDYNVKENDQRVDVHERNRAVGNINSVVKVNVHERNTDAEDINSVGKIDTLVHERNKTFENKNSAEKEEVYEKNDVVEDNNVEQVLERSKAINNASEAANSSAVYDIKTEKSSEKSGLNDDTVTGKQHIALDKENRSETESINLQHDEAAPITDSAEAMTDEGLTMNIQTVELEHVLTDIANKESDNYNYKISDDDNFDGEFVYEKEDVDFDIKDLDKYQKESEALFKTFPNHQNASKYLIYYCNVKCGGLADRLKGITAVYMMSILTERRFAISMTTPCEIERFLEPNLLDWKYPAKKEIVGKTLQTIDCFERHDAYEIDFQKYDPDPKSMMKADVVQMKANQDWTRVYRKLSVTPRRFPQLYQYHSSELLRTIFIGLFKLSPELKALVDDFVTEKVNGSKLACLHARMGEEIYQRYTYREILIPLEFLKKFDSQENYKILVATDTEKVKTIAKHKFKNFVDTSGPILHIDFMLNGTMTKDRKCAGFMRSMVDHTVLQRCDQLVLTGSGFGVTAASIRHTSRGVYVYMRGNAVMPTRRELIRETFQWRCLAPSWDMKFYRNICDS